MTRVGKYMVYNPRKDKPVKYYDNVEKAFFDAGLINTKEKTDILVLKVVGNVENEKIKIQENEFKKGTSRELEIIKIIED